MTAYEDADGMIVVKGKLPPDIGAVFLKALEAASELEGGIGRFCGNLPAHRLRRLVRHHDTRR